MAFARLSIMDLSDKAMQPMESNDGNVVIVFNGEIYGYESMKRKLEKKYAFKTKSDTEIIMYAYIEYGDCFINLSDGRFAIVIYDLKMCIRDRAVGRHDVIHGCVKFLGDFPQGISGLHNITNNTGEFLKLLHIHGLHVHMGDHRFADRLQHQNSQGYYGFDLDGVASHHHGRQLL